MVRGQVFARAERAVERQRGCVVGAGDRLDAPGAGPGGQVVEPSAQPTAEPGPAVVLADRQQMQVGEAIGGHHAEDVTDVLPAGRPRERAEPAELVEPDRVVQRSGVGAPETVVRVQQARPDRGRGELGSPTMPMSSGVIGPRARR